MINVLVTDGHLATVSSSACADSLVKHAKGSTIGRIRDGQFLNSFDDADDAQASAGSRLTHLANRGAGMVAKAFSR